MSAAAHVRPATQGDVPQLARLFDQYRQFYHHESDETAAAAWMEARLHAGDAALFIGFTAQGEAAGLCQMYRSLCSLQLARIWIVHDLYVAPSARRQGLARLLMDAAREHAQASGAVRLELTTAHNNSAARQLYASQGWEQDLEYLTYTCALER